MITDELFLSVSQIVNVRVTPENLRAKMKDIASTGGVTSKVKTDILVELLIAFAKLEESYGKRTPQDQNPL